MSQIGSVVACALAASLALCADAFAQASALEQYKQDAMSYKLLKTNLDLHKAYERAGLSRNDWCRLAEAYDAYSVSLRREVEVRRYMTSSGFVDIRQSDLDRFKVWQGNVGTELRNAERRCR